MKKICMVLALMFCAITLFSAERKLPKPLESSIIGVSTASSHDIYVSEHFPTAKILRTQTFVDLIPMLVNGKCDYMVLDELMAKDIVERYPDLEVVVDTLFYDGMGAGFNKTSVALQQEFNQFLKSYLVSDAYKEIKNRWRNEKNGGNIPHVDIPKSDKTVKVGVCSQVYPYCIMIDGKLEGQDVELMRHFGADMGYNVEFVNLDVSSLISAAASGRVDLMISGLSITEERKKNFLFSDSYEYAVAQVVALKDKSSQKYHDFVMPKVTPSSGDVATLQDTIVTIIDGGRIASVEGTIQEIYISKLVNPEQVDVAKEYSDVFLMLGSDKTDYVITNVGIASTYVKSHSDAEIVLSNLLPTDCCYGVRKSSGELLSELDKFILKLRESGECDRLFAKWMEVLDDGRIEDMDLDKNEKVLRVGSSCNTAPFNFIAHHDFEGLDIEVLALFCKENGYRLEVLEMPFSSLIPALETSKIDLIANCLSPTLERKKVINFTEPYAYSYSVLTRKKELNSQYVSADSDKPNFFESLKTTAYNNLILEHRYKLILSGLLLTIVIAVLSIFFGTIWGGVLCFFTLGKNKILHKISEIFVAVMHGTPVLVILMINFYVVFAATALPSAVIAIISFAMYFGAYVSEMFVAGIEGIDKGQTEAGLALGFSKVKTFIYIVAPQAARRIMPIYMGDAISTFKTTSVVGYIAVQDLTKVGDIIRSRTFDAFFPLIMVALLYFIASFIFSKLLGKLADKTLYKH